MRNETAKMLLASIMIQGGGVALGPRYNEVAPSREDILSRSSSTGSAHQPIPRRRDKRSRKQRHKEGKR